jgi:hypothetical protein
MIVRPGKPTGSLDQRLHTLVDPELSERLRAAHPELFAAPAPADPAPPHAQSILKAGAANPESWWTPAIIGLLLALAGISALVWAARPHASNNVAPFVSLSSMVAPRVTKHPVWNHRNLSPAAAQKIIDAQQLWLRQHPVAVAIVKAAPPVVAPRLHSIAPQQRQAQPKGRTALRTRPSEQVRPRHATAIATSSSTDTSPATATEAAAADVGENDPTDSDITGRQIPQGPVWTDSAPGSVIFGHGGSGGGGLPSCTPRRFGF